MKTRRPLLRGLFILVGLCGLIAVTGAIYQIRATREDLKAYPAPGKMVNVNELNYHIKCMGTGTPTIILEAGLGENSLSWYPVQARLAQATQVCSYDRAGLGWSDLSSELMSPDRVAADLHDLLQNASITSPLLLVCHSRGGIFCRNYYHLYPNQVKGLVLVDSTHEQAPFRQYLYDKKGYIKQRIQMLIAPTLSRIGIIRLMGWANADRQPSPLPANILAAKTAVQNRTDTTLAVVNEIAVMRRGLDPSTPAPSSLGNLPLVVLTSGKRIDAKKVNSSEEDAAADAKIESTLQDELTALSSNSKHVIAEKSGHFIMYDQPNLVVSNVLKMLNSIR